MNDLDDQLAKFHATRLLTDGFTNPMSGEPAATAIKVLASQDELLPTYGYISQKLEKTTPELLSECLSHLTAMPVSLVPWLIERLSDSQSELVLVGLFDLLVGHQEGPRGTDFLKHFLSDSRLYNAYRHLVTLIVATRKEELIQFLIDSARFEQDKEKCGL